MGEKCYYYVNAKQYREIFDFYLSLGYSDEDAKRLADNCFGHEISVSDDLPYQDHWEFDSHAVSYSDHQAWLEKQRQLAEERRKKIEEASAAAWEQTTARIREQNRLDEEWNERRKNAAPCKIRSARKNRFVYKNSRADLKLMRKDPAKYKALSDEWAEANLPPSQRREYNHVFKTVGDVSRFARSQSKRGIFSRLGNLFRPKHPNIWNEGKVSYSLSGPDPSRANYHIPTSSSHCISSYSITRSSGKRNRFNTSSYDHSDEKPAVNTMDASQSIFSANVGTSSWSNLRQNIMLGDSINPNSIRIEEIINSYNYDLKSSDDLFSLSVEYSDCLWNDNDLLFLGIKSKELDRHIRQNLVLLIDNSGSMDHRSIIVQMTAAAFMSKLEKGDTLSIITYSTNTDVIVRNLDGSEKSRFVDAMMTIPSADGGTDGSEGLEMSYDYLSKIYDKTGNNRVFILTDGDFNFGITDKSDLADFIYKKRKSGIYLSVLGFGKDNYMDDNMTALSRNGNGNYNAIMCPDDIRENVLDKFISTSYNIMNDVKINVEFNPKYVKNYRLIGYNERALTREEFDDDKKAVDGIGYGHNVVGLYSIARGTSKQNNHSRYVKNESTDSDEFAFVEIRYKDRDGKNQVYTSAITFDDIKHKSDNIMIASTLACFGEIVSDSEAYKKDGEKMCEFCKDVCANINDDSSHMRVVRKYFERLSDAESA